MLEPATCWSEEKAAAIACMESHAHRASNNVDAESETISLDVRYSEYLQLRHGTSAVPVAKSPCIMTPVYSSSLSLSLSVGIHFAAILSSFNQWLNCRKFLGSTGLRKAAS